MNRLHRDVKSLIFIALATLIALVLASCGGGGGTATTAPGLPFTRTPIDSQVQLPTGSPLQVQNLQIWSSAGTVNPNSSGQAAVPVFNNGPQYADVRDDQNRLILASFVGTDNPEVNATTTAEALVFLALGGHLHRDTGPETILAGVKDLAGFNTVVAEVENQLITDGYITFESGNLKTAIDNCIAPITDRGRGTIADPTNASGIILDTLIDGELKVTQNYMRRTRAWLRKTGYTPQNGQFISDPSEYTSITLPTPTRYGSFTGTLANIVQGNFAWSPVTAGPYPIPLSPNNAESTQYEFIVVGPGGSAGDYDLLTVEQKAAAERAMLESVYMDVVIPAIANVIVPLKGEAIDDFFDFLDSSTYLADLINLTTQTAPNVLIKLSNGQIREAIEETMTSVATTTSGVFIISNAALAYIEVKGYGGPFTDQDVSDRLALIGAVDLVFNSAELGIYIAQVADSQKATVFNITTTGGKISVVPDRPILAYGEETTVKAVIQDKNPDAAYAYRWTVSDGFRLESSTNGMDVDGVLETSQDTVTLSATKFGKAKITCEVTRVDREPDVYVNRNETTVEYIHAPEFEPSQPEISVDQSIKITGSYDGTHSTLWNYTLTTPALGTIDRTSIGTNPSVNFTSNGNEGSAKITAEMYVVHNGQQVQVYTTQLTIQIGDSAIYTNVYAYTINSYPRFNNSTDIRWAGYVYAYKVVPRIPGAVRYEFYPESNPNVVVEAFHVNSGPVEFGYQQENNPGMDPWWVYRRSYFRADMESEQEAIDYCLQEGIPRLRNEVDNERWKLRTES